MRYLQGLHDMYQVYTISTRFIRYLQGLHDMYQVYTMISTRFIRYLPGRYHDINQVDIVYLPVDIVPVYIDIYRAYTI